MSSFVILIGKSTFSFNNSISATMNFFTHRVSSYFCFINTFSFRTVDLRRIYLNETWLLATVNGFWLQLFTNIFERFHILLVFACA